MELSKKKKEVNIHDLKFLWIFSDYFERFEKNKVLLIFILKFNAVFKIWMLANAPHSLTRVVNIEEVHPYMPLFW